MRIVVKGCGGARGGGKGLRVGISAPQLPRMVSYVHATPCDDDRLSGRLCQSGDVSRLALPVVPAYAWGGLYVEDSMRKARGKNTV